VTHEDDAPREEIGVSEQPDVVVVVVAPLVVAGVPGSVPASPSTGPAPVSRPVPAHSVLHFDATQFAIVFRAAFDAHSAAASFVFKHT
jgi:hypothetical protein